MIEQSKILADQVIRWRNDFPILKTQVNGKPLVYFDNGATAQKPKSVIEAVAKFYREGNSNIHRGVHSLSQQATEAYENARKSVATFIGASSHSEIVFCRGVTEAINLIASGLSQELLKRGDKVLISEMEHHANIVPWQMLEKRMGIEVKVIPVTDLGDIDLEVYEKLLKEHQPKLVGLVHLSNSLGTINPVSRMIEMAHSEGALFLLDGAQSVPHMPVNVQELNCDFFVFSSHKVFGPTGTGVLYGKYDLLEKLPAYQGGGDMIEKVSFSGTTFKAPPEKFEAGTPNIAGVIGLGAAIDYLGAQDREAMHEHESELLTYAESQLVKIDGLKVLGQAKEKAAVCSFTIEGIHPHDIGSFLDAEGIAIRTGHHCTMPLMERFGIPGTARASFCFYNTLEEVDALVTAVRKIKQFFG